MGLDKATGMRTDLDGAQLWNIDLRKARFGNAMLSDSTLLKVDLSGKDLRHIDLQSAVLVGTNLRNSELTIGQFTGAMRPYLCNVVLPENLIIAGIDPHKDCAVLDKVMEYHLTEETQEEGQRMVEEAIQKKWD